MLSDVSDWLYGASGLTPHGVCLLWETGLVWLFAISDTLIALAYFSIPLVLVIVGRRRSDLVYRPLLWLFAVFILLCGASHWLDVVTIWNPIYGFQGVVKAATAVASGFTAIALWWFLPSFLALPSPDQLSRANIALQESEERLVRAQKLEALGRLTGGIAHDFNNVLQVISSSIVVIDRLGAEGRGIDVKSSIEAIKKASGTASNLVNRLLAFSRRQDLKPRVIHPGHLILGLEEILRRTLGPGIDLELKLGDSEWNVACDSAQLESALLNLTINARDAMPTGGVLTIETFDRPSVADPLDPDAEEGDYVEIEVTDNGVGMSADVLVRAFEPFFTTKPADRGTGLGLSQTYGFVKQSGGFMQIESKSGQGASVQIYLPRSTASVELVAEQSPSEATHAHEPGDRRRGN